MVVYVKNVDYKFVYEETVINYQKLNIKYSLLILQAMKCPYNLQSFYIFDKGTVTKITRFGLNPMLSHSVHWVIIVWV